MKCEIQDGGVGEGEAITLDRVLHALADPVRRGILREIAARPGAPCAALAPTLPRSTVSVHLRALRAAGLIAQERRGQLILNTAREDGAAARYPHVVAAVLAAADD